MEDLKKIQEFFSKPLKEGILTPDDLASYRDNAMEKLANADIIDKKLGKTRQGDKYIMIMYKEKWDFANPPKTGMYNPETQWVKVFYNDESEIQDLMALKENTTNWPKEVPSRYGDIIFRLVKVMPDRAKYELIDAETGKTWETGGRVYGTVNQLKASAEDTIKPQGGRQSSYFGSVNEDKKLTYNNFVQMVRDDMMAGAAPDEYPSDERVRKDAKYLYNRYLQGASVDDLFEASLGSTKSQSLANAINSAMLQIDDSMSYTDFANAVASILIDEYGTHNFTPFMEVLHARLGMNESLNEADLNNATKKEYNALLDKEYELTKAYSKDKTDANWKKLSDIRKKGKKLEKELEDQGLLEASKKGKQFVKNTKPAKYKKGTYSSKK